MKPYYLSYEFWVGVVLAGFILNSVTPYFNKFVIDKILNNFSKKRDDKRKKEFILRNKIIMDMAQNEKIIDFKLAIANQQRIIGAFVFFLGGTTFTTSIYYTQHVITQPPFNQILFVCLNMFFILLLFSGIMIFNKAGDRLDQVETAISILLDRENNLGVGEDNIDES